MTRTAETTRWRRLGLPAIGIVLGLVVGVGAAVLLLPDPKPIGPEIAEAGLPELSDADCAERVGEYAQRLGIDEVGTTGLGRCSFASADFQLVVDDRTGVIDGSHPIASVGAQRAWSIRCATITFGEGPVEIPLASSSDPHVCGTPLPGVIGFNEFAVLTDRDHVIEVSVIGYSSPPPDDIVVSILGDIGSDL